MGIARWMDSAALTSAIKNRQSAIGIRNEIREIEQGKAEKGNNVLSNSPHTLADVLSDGWNRPYSREHAGFPSAATRMHKVWPTVSRIDQAYGDRNLVCACPPVEAFA